MKIYLDIKNFIKGPDEFAKCKAKESIFYSVAMKIIAILCIVFSFAYQPFLIPATIFLLTSFYVDHKIIKNMDPLIYYIFDKCINDDPYNKGFYEGSLIAGYIKGLPKRSFGFLKGFYKEMF